MDGLWLKARITPITVAGETRTNPSHILASSVIRTTTSDIPSKKPSLSSYPPLRKTGPWGFSLKYPLTSLFAGNHNRYDAVAVQDTVSVDRMEEKKEESEKNGQNGNWVLKVLQVRSLWKAQGNDHRIQEGENNRVNHQNEVSMDEECDACWVDDDIEFDKNSFSKLLRKVSLAEARLYAQMSYLGSLSYIVPKIKPGNLLKRHRLRFVTTSLEKKAELAAKAEKHKASDGVQEGEEGTKRKELQTLKAEKGVDGFQEDEEETKYGVENQEKSDGHLITASTAYRIASSAASYLHSHTKSIIPFKSTEKNASDDSSEGENEVADSVSMTNTEVASFMATTDSETAVVPTKVEAKQAVPDDLNSTCSSPCEWFSCDDDESSTRYFVIQGSESLASWQANLLFEPIQFEALDVLVHRGIYEAAKGVYEEMLPEVHEHLQCHGNRATIGFTGHSLGGSLSLLVNLMLLIRGEVPSSSLLPVITFGAPSVMCGGNRLLHKLGLPRSHLQGITMHRDIVPRAFSCNYPSRVAELLKAVNGNFRNHPCLNNQNPLYAPMGELLILQPDAKLSPSHELLPSGSGLYVLRSQASDASEKEKQTRAAESVFLNTPHPLEILSDRSAYGSEGAIQRDHDVETYLTSIRSVIRQELNRVRRTRREHRRQFWWPLVAGGGGVFMMRVNESEVKWSGVLESGIKWLRQHMHLLVVVLLPTGLLIVEWRHAM